MSIPAAVPDRIFPGGAITALVARPGAPQCQRIPGEAISEWLGSEENLFPERRTLAPEGFGCRPLGAEFHRYNPDEPGWETTVSLGGWRRATLHTLSSRVLRAMANPSGPSCTWTDWYDDEWVSDRGFGREQGVRERQRRLAAETLAQGKTLYQLGIRRVVPGVTPARNALREANQRPNRPLYRYQSGDGVPRRGSPRTGRTAVSRARPHSAPD